MKRITDNQILCLLKGTSEEGNLNLLQKIKGVIDIHGESMDEGTTKLVLKRWTEKPKGGCHHSLCECNGGNYFAVFARWGDKSVLHRISRWRFDA